MTFRRSAELWYEFREPTMRRATPHSPGVMDLAVQGGGHLAQLLDAFSPKGRAQFEEMAKARAVPSRSVLVAEGEDPAEIGFVLAGTLAMSKLLPDGRTHIIGLLVPTDMYGRVFNGPHRHRIEALSDAHLLCVRRALFEALLMKEPEAERLLLVHAFDELDIAREWAVLLSGSKVVNRVASFLVMLARRGKGDVAGPSRPLHVKLDLSRADLASYLGTRPETLSRAFHELADKDIIRIVDPYRFQIVDLPALLDVSGRDPISSYGGAWRA